MDEIANQLKRLADVSEAAVDPVTAAEAMSRADAIDAVVDIGLDEAGPTSKRKPRRALSPRALAAAAALVALVVGSVALIDRDDDAPVDVASAVQLGQTFTGPEDDNGWQELRQCESKNTYDADTGNTFYGAYQFTREAFRDTATDLRLFDYVDSSPADAPPHVQDAIANALYLDRGAEAWPVCGRHIRGPMITPVVPQWLQYSTDVPDVVVVFVDPGTASQRVADIGNELAELGDLDPESELRFVSQEEAYVEFRSRFEWTAEEIGSIRLEDLPPRYELLKSIDDTTVAAIRELDDIFEAFPAGTVGSGVASGPLRVSIPAIGLEAAIYSTPTNGALAVSGVLMVDSPDGLVIAGYGSLPGSVFEHLDQLGDGDIIRLSMLITDDRVPFELVLTYEVDLANPADPPIYDLDEMLLWQAAEGPGLTLVADVEGDATQRFVLRARAIGPDPAGYPMPGN